jgi:RNA polymerase sigma factor (sigma-70 family)
MRKLRDSFFQCDYQPVTREEELALTAKFRAGDHDAGEALVKSVLPWAVNFTRKIAHQYGVYDDDEIVSVAQLAAWKAVLGYNPEQFNTRLTTYTAWWTRGLMKAGQTQLIRPPTNLCSKEKILNAGGQLLLEQLDRNRQIISLSQNYGGDNSDDTRAAIVPDPNAEDPAIKAAAEEYVELCKLKLRWAISRLPTKERYILEFFTYDSMELAPIGRLFGESRELMRQRMNIAKERLKKYVSLAPKTVEALRQAKIERLPPPPPLPVEEEARTLVAV